MNWIFYLISWTAVCLFAWMVVHPFNAGHMIVLIALCVLGISMFPFTLKKGLPKVKGKKLRWEVTSERFISMKFYHEKIARAYASWLIEQVTDEKLFMRIYRLTGGRANNPINVLPIRNLTQEQKACYLAKKRDGKLRTFRPDKTWCTSLIPTKRSKNTGFLARRYKAIRRRVKLLS